MPEYPEISVLDAVSEAIKTLPGIEQKGPAAAVALALSMKLDDPDTSAAGAAAASKELLNLLTKLGVLSVSAMRTVLPNSPNKDMGVGDELDKLRKRRNTYDAG